MENAVSTEITLKKLVMEGFIDEEAGMQGYAHGEDVIGVLEEHLVQYHNTHTGEALNVLDVYWQISPPHDGQETRGVVVRGVYLP